MPSYIIGIDGGGTHTRAVLADAGGRVLGKGEAGTSNPNPYGYKAAQDELLDAIRKAFAGAGIKPCRVDAACFGIGGVDREQERERIQKWALRHVSRKVYVTNDSETVLAAGTPENWGIVLISGTGSMSWGKSPEGKVARASGYGYLIGDEGSGFDLACRALRAATQAYDGRGEPTILFERILQHWKIKGMDQLIPYVYHSGLHHDDFAAMARVVVSAASEGDHVASVLLDQTAEFLASSVTAVARALNFRTSAVPLALTGGLVTGTPSLQQALLQKSETKGFRFGPVKVVREPVKGAVIMARSLL